MIWLRRLTLLFLAVFLGLVVLLAGVVLVFDEGDYKQALGWVADRVLDTTLVIDGRLSVQYSNGLVLSVDDVKIDAHDDSYHLSLHTLRAVVRPRPLLSGTLWLDDLAVNRFYLRINESATDSRDWHDPGLNSVIIARANIRDFVIEYQEMPPGTLHQFSLSTLQLENISDDGSIGLRAQGTFEGEDIRISGTLPSIDDVLSSDIPKPVELDIKSENSHAHITGTIIDPVNGEGLDLHLKLATSDTTKLLELLGDGIPEVGVLQASAILRGNYESPRLVDIDAHLQRGAEVAINASGRVDDIYTGAGLNLHIDGHSEQPNVASWLLFGKLEQLKSLEFNGAIKEKDGHFYLSDLDAAATTRTGLSVAVHGNTEIYHGEHLFLKSDTGINATFSAPSTAAMNLLEVTDVPELGAVSGRFKLLVSADAIGLYDADVRIGGKGNSSAHLQGQIRKIPLLAEFGATGIDLQLAVQSPDIAALARKLDYTLPAMGPGEASMNIIGDLENLKLKHVNIRTGDDKGILITAEGNVDRVVLGKSMSLDNALFDITAHASDLSKLSGLAGIDLPKLGQTVLSSTMTLNSSTLQFNDVKVNVGRPDQPVIRLHGKVTTQLHKGSTVHVDYSMAVADLVAAYAETAPGYLGRLQGTAEVSDIDGSWGIEKFALASSQTSLYQVKMRGGFDDLKNSDLVNIQVDLEIDDPAALGHALGINLSGLKTWRGQGHFTSEKDMIVYNGTMSVGKTASTTTIHGHTRQDVPTFRGHFSVPVLDLTDFGFLLEQEADTELLASPESSEKDYLFSREPLRVAFLNDFGLDLQINIDEVESYGKTSIDSVTGHIFLKDGELKLDPLQFVYAGGTMNMVFNLQATEPPVYALKVIADDLILGPMLAQVQHNTQIDGRTNVLLDITSSGNSAHELVSSLSGRINIELENARIPKRYADYLSVDVFGWALSNTLAGQQYVNLNCVVADFTADGGEIKSKLLLADGPNMSLGGRVDLDLRDETIDAVLLPKQKRRLFSKINPVKLSGPIREPKVLAIPAQAAIQEIGLLALSPTIYLSTRLLEKVWLSVSKGGDPGEGCSNIEKLTDQAEKAKKKDQPWKKPASDDAWWLDQ